MSLQLIDFKNFNPTHSVIKIPKNILLLRGYHTGFPAISSRPAYFTSYKEIVDSYANKDKHILGYFKTTIELKLLDLRYIRLILRDFLDVQLSTAKQYPNVIDCIYSIFLALGICSSIIQLNLYKMRYRDQLNDKNSNIYKALLNMDSYFKHQNIYNPIDPQGIRIAETTNDISMILCLREIFGNNIHGYIMPDVFSPYHIEKTNNILNGEIVLFNPLESHIELLNIKGNADLSKLGRYSIQDVYKNEPYTSLRLSYTNMNPITFVTTGGSTNIQENPNIFFDKGGVPYKKLLKYTRKAMRQLLKPGKNIKKIRSHMEAGSEETISKQAPFVVNPTVPVSPWTNELYDKLTDIRLKQMQLLLD